MTKQFPDRVYKIVHAPQWHAAVVSGIFEGSADDKRDGFIHLSTAEQLPGTIAKYFRGQSDVLLVAYDCSTLALHLKWEASRGGLEFPHYYAPLPTAAALWSSPMPLGVDDLPSFNKERL
jgi:uncharacterized protein (DUF952 family)